MIMQAIWIAQTQTWFLQSNQ